jgi:pimeloyl-ACP methyl ester carboxylesterase
MPYFTHDGADLFYTDQGAGPVVLLLHGWSCDSHDWSWQIPALAGSWRVIALDQRGHGRSSAPHGSYRPQVLADDAAALLRALGVEQAVVGGHSMGTVVASALAVRHPDLVGALVLVDPVYGTPDERLAPVLAAMRAGDPVAIAAASFEQAFYTDRTPEFLRTWHLRRVLGMPGHVVSGCLSGLYEGDEGIGRAVVAADYLRQRTAPRLAVYASAAAATFERSLPAGDRDEIHLWDGAGHFLHQERPEEFNRLLLGWL